MATRHGGIDEAGYGPLLGPLVIATVGCSAPAVDPAAIFAAEEIALADSKLVHRPGDLGAVERIALAGLRRFGGADATTAAAVFARLGEAEADRELPWQEGAEDLALPVAATAIPSWRLPDLDDAWIDGRIVHPRALNDAVVGGENKAAVELGHVVDLVGAQLERGGTSRIVCDRLGGRRYYAPALGKLPGCKVEVAAEEKPASRYRLRRDRRWHAVDFVVGGETASPLCALASCIAKYARELHLILFNRWWGERVKGLQPTAGYPQDARRWLDDIGRELVEEHGPDLVRGYTGPSLF